MFPLKITKFSANKIFLEVKDVSDDRIVLGYTDKEEELKEMVRRANIHDELICFINTCSDLCTDEKFKELAGKLKDKHSNLKRL